MLDNSKFFEAPTSKNTHLPKRNNPFKGVNPYEAPLIGVQENSDLSYLDKIDTQENTRTLSEPNLGEKAVNLLRVLTIFLAIFSLIVSLISIKITWDSSVLIQKYVSKDKKYPDIIK